MRAVLLVLAILFGAWWLGAPTSAFAQTAGQSCNGGTCDQGDAYTACMSHPVDRVTRRRCDVSGPYSSGSGSYHLVYWYKNTSNEEIGPVNSVNNFLFQSTCTTRNTKSPPGDAALWYSAPPTCVSGCQILGTPISQSNGGVKVYGMTDRYYTGSTCDAPTGKEGITPDSGKEEETKPKPPECTAMGSGQTACVKPNGDHCATASTGKTFCWSPQEKGHKIDGNDAQGKSEKDQPVTPPSTPPAPDKDWQRKEGYQSTACVNNTCTTYNYTNYQGTEKGGAKNSTGNNSEDGAGNTSGNGAPGKGSSGGDKDGEGDSASDSGNCDQAPACVGDTLKCLHLKFTWKIQCNTKGSEISNGNGCGENDVPVCAGSSCKAEAYAQVVQQWKQRCAVEAMGQGMAQRASKISNPDDEGVLDGIWIKEGNGNGPKLRQDLVNVGGGGGSLLPSVSIDGQKWEVPQGFYDAIAAIRMVIIAMCTVVAMFVVGRNI